MYSGTLKNLFSIKHSFIAVTLIYIISTLSLLFYMVSYLNNKQNEIINNNIDKLLKNVLEVNGLYLEDLSIRLLKTKAEDIAQQLSLLSREEKTNELLIRNKNFSIIANQRFFKTGYVVISECTPPYKTLSHPWNDDVVGVPMPSFFKKKYFKLWEIHQKGVRCQRSHGMYQYQKKNGKTIHKYVYMVPTNDLRYTVSATMHLYELNESKRAIHKTINTNRLSLINELQLKSKLFIKKSKILFLIILLIITSSILTLSTILYKNFNYIRELVNRLALRKYQDFSLSPTLIKEFNQIQIGLDKMRIQFIKYQEESCQKASLIAHSKLAKQIAHDLRSPIEALKYILRELKEKNGNGFNITKLLEETLSRLSSMIESILSPKKNYLGKTERFDLTPLMSEMTSFAKYKIEESKKKITTYNDTKIKKLEIIGSLNNITRVIENIIKNAIEASSQEGMIRLCASIEKEEVEITIKDTGRGIPLGREKDIFAQGVTIGKKTGTGLGLYTSRMIVFEHGGTIKIKNNNDSKGTTFSISLPRVLISKTKNRDNTTIEIEEGKYVIAIDDKVDILSRIHTALAFKGIEGGFYNSFEEFLKNEKWDCLKKNCSHIILDNVVANSDYNAIGAGSFIQDKLGREFPITIITSDTRDKQLNEYSQSSGIPIYPKSFLDKLDFSLI